MVLAAIVAVSDNDVIGYQGGIPWRIKGEQRRAKDITMGYPLIMGRKTHESIGRTLPGRLNVVISRNPGYKVFDGSVLVGSLKEALELPKVSSADKAFIFGGQAIFQEAMPQLQQIYLTRVHAAVPGDSFFKYDPVQWQETEVEKHAADQENPYDYEFITLKRQS